MLLLVFSFVLQLVISYEYYLKKELFKALEGITDLELYLLKLTSCCEWLFIGIKDVLWHVVTASKAFLLLEMNKIEDADRVKSIGVDLTAFKTCIRTNCGVCVTAIATKRLDKLKKTLGTLISSWAQNFCQVH